MRPLPPSLGLLAAVLIAACGARSELLAPPLPDAGLGDAGEDVEGGQTVGLPPIDPACSSNSSLSPVYPPYVPLVPPDVPADCANGFELGDATPGSIYTLGTNQLAGAAAITLDVDFATYYKPDAVVITGFFANGTSYTLMDSCRLRTWTASDPTQGMSRPPDQTIRQFRIDVLAGTTRLVVDFSGVVSPMYIQILGLCDFDVKPFPDAVWWQAVP